ncbi:MAG: lectin like domain-containing protein [Bacteroidales bacterium]|nr:lectin like domain-containing protein [Bacteroidales bacterium]
MGAVLFADVRKPEYDNFYYHDYHGWVDTLQDAIAVFNRFEVGNDEYIKSISFVTAEDDVDYTLEVYKDFENGMLRELIYSHQGEAEYAGYHSTDLSPVAYLDKDKPFYIYLKLSGGLYAYDRTHHPDVLNAEVMGPVDQKPHRANPIILLIPDGKTFMTMRIRRDFNSPETFALRPIP